MNRRLGFLAGVVLGFVAGVSCAPVVKSTDTTVRATFYFHPGSGTRQLDISGTRASDGIEVYQRAQRPTVDDPDASFLSPQSVRIFLQSGAAQQPFTLSVLGLDTHGGTMEEGSADVTPVLNDEVAVDVFLKLFVEPPDGGDPDAGFTFDAGADAGFVPCQCNTGCCYPGTPSCIAFQVPLSIGDIDVFSCGRKGAACRDRADLCNSFTADRCGADGGCACGSSGLPCPAGLRCNGGQCGCSHSSGCAGCCDNNDTCLPGSSNNNACGGGGNQCAQCGGGLTDSCTSGRCGTQCGFCGRNSCCSGNNCESLQFPLCVGAAGSCITCDLLRSSACGRNGVDIVPNATDCRCGDGGACSGTTPLCMKVNGVFTCVAAQF